MFLWARLVLMALEDASNMKELKDMARTFPKDFENVYSQILANIRQRVGVGQYDKVLRILGWVAFAKRRIKSHELQWGLVLHHHNTQINAETKPINIIYDICKPFVEDGPNGTVVFAHSSIKEYG
jgi:hypothetical protein